MDDENGEDDQDAREAQAADDIAQGIIGPVDWSEHYYWDLGYHVRVRPFEGHADSMSMDYEVRELMETEMPESGKPLFQRSAENLPTDDVEAATLFMSGNVKWDGCSNHDFHTDECLMHLCGKRGVLALGTLMGRLYDLAAETMPRHKEHLT